MFSQYNKPIIIFLPILLFSLFLLAAWFTYGRFAELQSQLSVKPPNQSSNFTLEAIESTLGLHATLPYETLRVAAEQATDQPQTGTGERQACKRILGAQVCATTLWRYQIERAGSVKIARRGDAVRLTLPLSLNGSASIDGRGGKLFGLRNKKFSGLIELNADLKVSIGEDWCPIVTSRLNHQWLSDPKIQVAGKLKINLRKSANKAINKKMQQLEKKLTTIIDCSQFRNLVAENWKVHHIPLKIPGQHQAYLELIPRTVAVSKARPHDDHISVAFEMLATTEVVNALTNQTPLDLPNVLPDVAEPGLVEFSLLLNLTYPQIRELVSARLLGKIQGSGDRTFLITSFDLYPSNERLIFDLGFSATGFGKFMKSTGQLYLSARPVADPDSNELRFEDLQFTRIIDNELWSMLSTVLHQRILESLRKAAVIDLAPQVEKLEKSIADTLANPQNTANIVVESTPPQVRLIAVNPQAESLAAIVHISTRLDATIPPEALIRQ